MTHKTGHLAYEYCTSLLALNSFLLPALFHMCSGLGKTQWCFGACATAYIPVGSGGLGGGTLWFDTEGAFSIGRIIQIAQQRHRPFFADKKACADFVTHLHPISLAGAPDAHKLLLDHLMKIEDLILEKGIKLVSG